MADIQEIIAEYRKMRDDGLGKTAVLKALRHHIDPLDKAERKALARHLRAWEDRQAQGADAATLATTFGVPDDAARVNGGEEEAEPEAVECTHCGTVNDGGNVFCHQCGHVLDTRPVAQGTTLLDETSNKVINRDEFFGAESVLVLLARDSQHRFEIRPQRRNYEIVLGRTASGSAMTPDIDLSEEGAKQMGVSRLHLALNYDAENHHILVYDLGSANGSYLNGQRLQPQEMRILRHGDTLRLSKLVLKAYFRHPGEGSITAEHNF